MAGPTLDRELTTPRATRVRFAVATGSDDAAIRRLLRANPMRGEVSLTFEREPDYFHGTDLAGADDKTFVAYEGERLLCMGRCSVQSRFINGQPARVGYLGELRLDASVRGRFDVLRRGYRFFREVYRDDAPDLWFTSIAADNHRSIRFLERGLPGMPRYEFLTEFETLLIPVPRGKCAERRLQTGALRCVPGSQTLLPEMVSCLNAHARRHQLATEWTSDNLLPLERCGLPLSDFIVVLDGVRMVACAALWDQRSFRQTVIRGYGGRAALVRPWINLAAPLIGSARLPAVGSTLAHALLSPLALDENRADLLATVVEKALALSASRGIEFVTLGFEANDPAAATLRKYFRVREYRSRIYRVSWPDADAPPHLDGRTILPEVALL